MEHWICLLNGEYVSLNIVNIVVHLCFVQIEERYCTPRHRQLYTQLPSAPFKQEEGEGGEVNVMEQGGSSYEYLCITWVIP